jgi:hypothetical protein
MWREKRSQDANVYIQKDPNLVKIYVQIHKYVCVEKILQGNATKYFWGCLRMVD